MEKRAEEDIKGELPAAPESKRRTKVLGNDLIESGKSVKLPILGGIVNIEERKLFHPTIEELVKEFKGYQVLYSRKGSVNQAGVLHNMKYDGKDLFVYCRAKGLSKFFIDSQPKRAFEWFKVRELGRILLEGPEWGAACFGSVGMWVTFWSNQGKLSPRNEYTIELAGWQNGSFQGAEGAYPNANCRNIWKKGQSCKKWGI